MWDKPLPSKTFHRTFEVRWNKNSGTSYRVNATIKAPAGVTPAQIAEIAIRSRVITKQNALRRVAENEGELKKLAAAGVVIDLIPSSGGVRSMSLGEALDFVERSLNSGELSPDEVEDPRIRRALNLDTVDGGDTEAAEEPK